ncbi:unnamed protein product [Oikopleura dioica]|uniref:Uncharacterized protein n=2 Tax=Oikopleura dioica TaxID=34765 RepID=E4XX38_OIKDI|nr:unnamed protein product [Oikopleura dioica]CBY40177.1 unnamed protein product [Oikopleura dioica]
MRSILLLFLSGCCQDYQARSYSVSNSPGPREIGEETFDICSRWIYEAMRCEPPRGKTSKYIHRFQKVIGDALWHVESTYKCYAGDLVGDRGRREGDMYSGEYDETGEYDEFGANTGNDDEYENVDTVDEIIKFEARSQMGLGRVRNDDLRSQCIESFDRFYEKTAISTCRKKYAWKNRTDGLTRQITKMMFLCMKSNGY